MRIVNGAAAGRGHRRQSLESMTGSVNLNAGVWRRAWRELVDALLPSPCLACGLPAARGKALCAPCADSLPHNRSACRACALPLPAGQHGALCGRCLRRPPPVSATLAPFVYADPLDRWIGALKFQRDLAAGQLMGELLAAALVDTALFNGIDALLPMPLHRRRLRERGFNQVRELLRPLTQSGTPPLRPDWLRRERETTAQSGLSAGERRRNLRGAFVADPAVRDQRVLLVDDVITTGSTIMEAARTLQRAGAAEVRVLALARVPRRAAG
jgi:ComF family protein